MKPANKCLRLVNWMAGISLTAIFATSQVVPQKKQTQAREIKAFSFVVLLDAKIKRLMFKMSHAG